MPDTAIAEAPAKDATGGTILQVRNLEAWYGESHILHGINFDVNAVAVQGRLGQVIDEGRDGGTVAAIKGTKGEGFGSEGHAGGFSHGAHSFMFCGRSRVGDTASVEAHGVFHIALVSASGPPQRLRSVKSTDHHHNKME